MHPIKPYYFNQVLQMTLSVRNNSIPRRTIQNQVQRTPLPQENNNTPIHQSTVKFLAVKTHCKDL